MFPDWNSGSAMTRWCRAMFVWMPDEGVLFVGYFIMPYLGAPFIEEGSVPGLLAAIDVAVSLRPRHLLHGHETLTRRWNSWQLLAELRPRLEWLYQATRLLRID